MLFSGRNMYLPLPDFLEIRPSPIHGLGLFTRQKISEETLLGVSHVKHPLFPDGWIRTPLGGFYNHSEQPNCHLTDSIIGDTPVKQLVTIRDIEEGEELTCYYTLYNLSMECKEATDWDLDFHRSLQAV